MRLRACSALVVMLCLSAVPAEVAAEDETWRIGTSSSDVRTATGAVFSADAGFVGGYRVDHPSGVVVHGTDDDELYRSERWGMRTFSWRVPSAGQYEVVLHLVDHTFEAPGARVFDVAAEGAAALNDVDIVAEVGPAAAYDPSFRVEVRDEALDLSFTSSANHANVSALTIRRISAAAGTGRTTASPRSGTWRSGAGGTGVADGAFGAWRGRPTEVAATWSDSNVASVELWQLSTGGEYSAWEGDLDIAVGALGEGETWAAAASGAYDARWAASLSALRDKWGDRPGQVYIRFAHEMNGSWYPWRVRSEHVDHFIEAWKRYRSLQQRIFPDSDLVFNVNRESVGSGIDWRSTFPGSAFVDVLGVDYYNQYPYVDSLDGFAAAALERDPFGAPKGLLRHLEFARDVGLPLAVSEWSGNAEMGDSPAFVLGMHAFFERHGGTGPGQVLYECLFNVDRDRQNWILSAGTRMPASAEAYRRAW